MDLRYGSADENVRKRSIQDIILHERQRFENRSERAGKIQTSKQIICDSGFGFGTETALICPSRAGELAVINAVNRLAAEGIRTTLFSPVVLLPPGTQEDVLRDLIGQICRRAFAEGIEIGRVQADVTDAVTRPLVIGTAAGESFFERLPDHIPNAGDLKEGDIIAVGPVGLEGTCILVCEQFKALRERFPMSILTRMMKALEELSILKEAEISAQDAPVMVSPGEGGFFAGLWELSGKTGCGLEADLQTVPILQETIEITDYFGINPYAMRSAGSLLIAARDGDRLIQRFAEKGRAAVRIGKLTAGKDKIIRNGEDVRYLDRPQTDALVQWYRESAGLNTQD